MRRYLGVFGVMLVLAGVPFGVLAWTLNNQTVALLSLGAVTADLKQGGLWPVTVIDRRKLHQNHAPSQLGHLTGIVVWNRQHELIQVAVTDSSASAVGLLAWIRRAMARQQHPMIRPQTWLSGNLLVLYYRDPGPQDHSAQLLHSLGIHA